METPQASPVTAGESTNPSPFLQVALNADGSVTRPFFPTLPPNPTGPVVSTDVVLNARSNTWLRLFVPESLVHQVREIKKLPIILFFHGGGFILFSAATIPYHLFCEKLAADVSAVIVSVEYRLAPEHRLPAAYEDAVDAIKWLEWQSSDPSRRVPALKHANFSQCFLMGSSSGGNIVYHTGIRMAKTVEKTTYSSIGISGLIMHQAFFYGKERTASELRLEDDPVIPLRANESMWELSLPEGADKDHEFMYLKKTAPAVEGLPKCLVTGTVADPIRDRQVELVKILEEKGVEVVAALDGKGGHAAELFDHDVTQWLIDEVKRFVVGA